MNDELASPIRVPLKIRLRMVPRGFLSSAYIVYNFAENDRREFLSDIAKRRTLRINSANARADYQAVVNNKLFFEAMLRPYARVPTIYGYISEGVLTCREPWKQYKGLSPSEICRRVAGPLVFKSVTGQKGLGVLIVTADSDGDRLLVNDKPVAYEAFDAQLRELDDHFVCEYITQSDHAAALYPHATNTIRALTLLDPGTHEPFMPIAVQRVGTNESAPVDNWNRRGLCAEIDLETGELGRAATFPYTGHMVWHETHPDTGAPIAGVVLADWPAVREGMIEIARELPFLRAVAWDILQTNDGFALIEGNGTADVRVFQMHRPLLRDERVRRFFEHYKVI